MRGRQAARAGACAVRPSATGRAGAGRGARRSPESSARSAAAAIGRKISALTVPALSQDVADDMADPDPASVLDRIKSFGK